jgi:prepilin-type N-terminal cleavage/methylation domain-containing protein
MRRVLLTENRGVRPAFTLIELVTVIVILGILSSYALPVYLDHRVNAKTSACKGVLGAMRVGIANYYTKSAAGGATPSYPTLTQLTTAGSVTMDTVSDNPFDTDATKNNVVDGTGVSKGTVTGTTGGWQYNPTNGQIWANTNTGGVGENSF